MQWRNFCLVSSLVLLSACANSRKAETPTSSAVAPTTQFPVVAATPVSNDAKVETPKDAMICKKGTDTRILEIEASQPKGCKLWYSRQGNRSNVASSSHGKAHCEQSRTKTGDTLKSAGFECVTAQTLPAPETTTVPASKVTPVSTPPAKVIPSATPAASPTVAPSVTPSAKPATSPSATPAVAPASTPKK